MCDASRNQAVQLLGIQGIQANQLLVLLIIHGRMVSLGLLGREERVVPPVACYCCRFLRRLRNCK